MGCRVDRPQMIVSLSRVFALRVVWLFSVFQAQKLAQGLNFLNSNSIEVYKDFIYLLLERGERREKEKKRNIDVREIHQMVASPMPPLGDLAHTSQGLAYKEIDEMQLPPIPLLGDAHWGQLGVHPSRISYV